ncbi:ABC transporter permease [uncultured Corynebacterium sp.]|uniref:ABC transporter permease n=1 Tax=Corynebacterium urealyticum TaxID=43771 RepID=A0A2W5CTZ4_9CORY|nr:ABC transporter permease [uncultured Corynebacterium sp.]PZO98485.1 MAG: ABC transporter permease [Corynebacterium urealyticum]
MFINTLHAEWTKLRTTKAFWWTTGLIFVIITLSTLIMSLNAQEAVLGVSPLQASTLGAAIIFLGVPIMMIQGIMVVTTEYSHKTQTITYLANPHRWSVAVAKLVLYGAIAALIAFFGLVYIFVLADSTTNASAAEAFRPFSDDNAKRMLWTYPLEAFGIVLFGQALGLLLRQTSGAVALALIWYLALENAIMFLPRVGEKIVDYLPITALNRWLNNSVPDTVPWDSPGISALIFFVWAIVLWIIGVILLEKRDA